MSNDVPLSESADCITRDRFPLKKFTWRKNKQEGRVCMYANLDRFVLWGGAAGELGTGHVWDVMWQLGHSTLGLVSTLVLFQCLNGFLINEITR